MASLQRLSAPDAKGHQISIMGLPPELIEMIFQCLTSAKDLKNFRTTCKYLCTASRKGYTNASLEVVRTDLSWHSYCQFELASKDPEQALLVRKIVIEPRPDWTWWKSPYGNHFRWPRENSVFGSKGAKKWGRAIKRFTNCTSFTISARYYYDPTLYLPDCRDETEYDTDEQEGYDWSYLRLEDTIELILDIIASGSIPVREFGILFPRRDMDSEPGLFLHLSSINRNLIHIGKFLAAWSNLQKFKFHFCIHRHRDRDRDSDTGFAIELIKAAKNLRHLSINFDHSHSAPVFMDRLHGANLENSLQAIELKDGWLGSSSDALKGFLRAHSSTLEKASLSGLGLNEGVWDEVFTILRTDFALFRQIELRRLMQRLDIGGKRYLHFPGIYESRIVGLASQDKFEYQRFWWYGTRMSLLSYSGPSMTKALGRISDEAQWSTKRDKSGRGQSQQFRHEWASRASDWRDL